MSVFLTVIVPLATAALLLALWTKPRLRRYVALLGSIGHVFAAFRLLFEVITDGEVTKQLGNWPAPFGITFVADSFSAVLVAVAALVGLVVNIYSAENLDSTRRDFGFHPLLFVLLAGVTGVFVTGDLFNLFVWFECILLSSFVLLSLGGERAQIRGALNYVVPNLFSSMLFLSGLGLLYGVAGTLNMADLANRIEYVPPQLMGAISLLFLIAFSVKAAIFPFFSWLPTSYHTPPVAITALFAGLLTKVGVYALFRFFTKVYPIEAGPVAEILLWASVATMIVGILAACVANDLKKILAYNIISHIGTMIAGLALLTKLGLEGGVFYMVHHILTITALFLTIGIVERHYGTTKLDKLGDALKTCPIVSVFFFILALALAGIPPLSGFWPKLILVQAAAEANRPVIVVSIIIVGLLTLYSVIRIWLLVFWRPFPGDSESCPPPTTERPAAKYVPVLVLTIAIVLIGLMPNALATLSQDAASVMRPIEQPQEGAEP